MKALRFALLTVVRQPTRTLLAVLGVAAVGSLLFDMLLLSRGLVISFRDLLDRAGYDVRVLAADTMPFGGPRIQMASAATSAIAALPEVEAVSPVRYDTVSLAGPDGAERRADLVAVDLRSRPIWTVVAGGDLTAAQSDPVGALLINPRVADSMRLSPGDSVSIGGACGDESAALAPLQFKIVGVAEFPFVPSGQRTVAADLATIRRTCGTLEGDRADILLVVSKPAAGAEGAAAAIRHLRPDLHAVTNEELVERMRRVEFAYFRQISVVLATVTLFFGFLLIAVLLSVSVNQRYGEMAALRALGLTSRRVVAGVLWESVLLVGAGGLIAIPLGLGVSVWLDNILRAMPGIPVGVHFFVFETRTVVLHIGLLSVTAVAAALYPMRLIARLPIAATLRREAVS